MSKLGVDMVKRLQKMPTPQAYLWLMNFYKIAYEEGLREGESEFDDAIILTEDEAKLYFGETAVDSLLTHN